MIRTHNPGAGAARKTMVIRFGLIPAALSLLAVSGCHTGGAAKTSEADEPKSSGARLIQAGGNTGIELAEDRVRLAGVTTAVAGAENLANGIQPTAEVAATDAGTVQVTSRLPGKIVQTYVSVGSQVRAGQVIATVDSVDLAQAEAAYQTAKSHAELTYNQLNQQRKLAKFGMVAEPAVEDARKTFAAAQAAVNSDQEQIKVDKIALDNTNKLLAMGEITHKPVEDALNASVAAHGALVQATVNLNSAKANLDRAKILFEGGIYSKQQYEDATTAYNNAVAAVDQSKTQEKLAADELARQQRIYEQNLNGASALQSAQSKLQQDQHTYQNDLTALDLARKQLARAQAVHGSGIPINQALQQAQDAYDEAKVAQRGAENTLRLYGIAPGQGVAQLTAGHALVSVLSPINGIVTARGMVAGQMVDTTAVLAKVVNLDSVYVDAQVYEKDLGSVAVGDPIQVRVAALPNRTFSGRVKYIGKDVSPDTRTITVRTVVPNLGWLLKPGMFAAVVIEGKGGGRNVTIPADAVMQRGSQQIVYVQVSPTQFVQRTVSVGPARAGRVPVYHGVEPGDKVVVTGNLLLDAEQRKLESEKSST